MSFLAKLTIDEQEYNVVSFSFCISRQVHHGTSTPSGFPSINHLRIKIESTKNSGFFAWSIRPREQKDGEIVFYKRDAMASSRTLRFTDAFCINYHEAFESNSVNPMVTSMVLATGYLELDNIEHVNLGFNQNRST